MLELVCIQGCPRNWGVRRGGGVNDLGVCVFVQGVSQKCIVICWGKGVNWLKYICAEVSKKCILGSSPKREGVTWLLHIVFVWGVNEMLSYDAHEKRRLTCVLSFAPGSCQWNAQINHFNMMHRQTAKKATSYTCYKLVLIEKWSPYLRKDDQISKKKIHFHVMKIGNCWTRLWIFTLTDNIPAPKENRLMKKKINKIYSLILMTCISVASKVKMWRL